MILFLRNIVTSKAKPSVKPSFSNGKKELEVQREKREGEMLKKTNTPCQNLLKT